MVKKIAAPRKAASKAQAGKKTKAKSISAPKTYSPKGSAKERLAYLNKDEMSALEARKGSPARRGPKGLPSFADDSASSKGVSRGGSGARGSGSTKTSRGSVSNASPGQRGAGGNYGPGSGRPGTKSSSSSSRGQGGQGAGRDSSRGLGKGAGGSAIGRSTPKSPMSGQGSSFSTPKKASDYNRTSAVGKPSTAAPRGMVGTPRGYVNAAAAAAVDKAMAPVAAIGKELPYFTPGIGPLVGGIAHGVPAAVRAAAPLVSKVAGEAAVPAERMAQINRDLQAAEAARRAAGRRPGELAVSMRSLPVSKAQREAWAKGPSFGEKAYNKTMDAVDAATRRAGLGVGEKARAKAISGLSAGHGLFQGSLEAGKSIGNSIRESRESEKNSKSDFGGYRAGGRVKTFKDKKNG